MSNIPIDEKKAYQNYHETEKNFMEWMQSLSPSMVLQSLCLAVWDSKYCENHVLNAWDSGPDDRSRLLAVTPLVEDLVIRMRRANVRDNTQTAIVDYVTDIKYLLQEGLAHQIAVYDVRDPDGIPVSEFFKKRKQQPWAETINGNKPELLPESIKVDSLYEWTLKRRRSYRKALSYVKSAQSGASLFDKFLGAIQEVSCLEQEENYYPSR